MDGLLISLILILGIVCIQGDFTFIYLKYNEPNNNKKECVDIIPNCKFLLANGMCRLRHIEWIVFQVCKETCGHCNTSTTRRPPVTSTKTLPIFNTTRHPGFTTPTKNITRWTTSPGYNSTLRPNTLRPNVTITTLTARPNVTITTLTARPNVTITTLTATTKQPNITFSPTNYTLTKSTETILKTTLKISPGNSTKSPSTYVNTTIPSWNTTASPTNQTYPTVPTTTTKRACVDSDTLNKKPFSCSQISRTRCRDEYGFPLNFFLIHCRRYCGFCVEGNA